jgi:hypothetical protein
MANMQIRRAFFFLLTGPKLRRRFGGLSLFPLNRIFERSLLGSDSQLVENKEIRKKVSYHLSV